MPSKLVASHPFVFSHKLAKKVWEGWRGVRCYSRHDVRAILYIPEGAYVTSQKEEEEQGLREKRRVSQIGWAGIRKRRRRNKT